MRGQKSGPGAWLRRELKYTWPVSEGPAWSSKGARARVWQVVELRSLIIGGAILGLSNDCVHAAF